jgi:carbonic anhydrase/acetyltransferase-like protein (isoleucine patch superfamily)
MNKTDFPEGVMETKPTLHESVFIAPGAQVMGNVEIGEGSSVWYNAVLRGDINKITIGERTNIQDGSVLHLENDRDCRVGSDVTIGHKALIHGCTIEDGCLIGMGAIILNGAVLKKGCVIGAGAVVKENTIVESGTLWVGVPAKQVKSGLDDAYDTNVKWAKKYSQLAQVHKKKLSK